MKIDLKVAEPLEEAPRKVKVSVKKTKDAVAGETPKARKVVRQERAPSPPPPPPPLPSFRVYRGLALGFAVVAVVLLGAVVYFSLTEAKVIVHTKREPVSTTLLTSFQEGIDGRIIKKTRAVSRGFSSSDQRSFEEKAKGKVTLINNFTKNQPLVATTRLLSPDGVLFRIQESVVVPAKGKIEVGVQADKVGKGGEIGPARFTIPGLWVGLQDTIFAESSAAMTGGVREVKVVSKTDIENAKKTLEEELSRSALQEVETEFGKPPISFVEIKKAFSNTQIGKEVSSFTYTMELDLVGIFFDRGKLLEEVSKKLTESITSPDRILASVDEETLTFFLEEYDPKESRANIKAYLEGESTLSPASTILAKEKIAGLTSKQVEDYFKGFGEIENVEVKMYPFWAKRLPLSIEQITIEIK